MVQITTPAPRYPHTHKLPKTMVQIWSPAPAYPHTQNDSMIQVNAQIVRPIHVLSTAHNPSENHGLLAGSMEKECPRKIQEYEGCDPHRHYGTFCRTGV